jgi:hypothetical protein
MVAASLPECGQHSDLVPQPSSHIACQPVSWQAQAVGFDDPTRAAAYHPMQLLGGSGSQVRVGSAVRMPPGRLCATSGSSTCVTGMPVRHPIAAVRSRQLGLLQIYVRATYGTTSCELRADAARRGRLPTPDAPALLMLTAAASWTAPRRSEDGRWGSLPYRIDMGQRVVNC